MSSGASGDRKRTPDEFLTRPDLEELLKEMKTECTNSIAGVMENALRKADANYQARFFKIESELMELKARVAQLEGWKPEVERQTSAMRQAVAMAEDKVPVASALDQEDFEKDPDLTIIRARAMDAITPSSLLDALGEIVRGGEDARWRVGTLSRALEALAIDGGDSSPGESSPGDSSPGESPGTDPPLLLADVVALPGTEGAPVLDADLHVAARAAKATRGLVPGEIAEATEQRQGDAPRHLAQRGLGGRGRGGHGRRLEKRSSVIHQHAGCSPSNRSGPQRRG